MPHKKNPDVFELIRARANMLKALPNEIFMITTNLPSGYHRDLQMIKESLLPAIDTLKSCLHMTWFMLEKISINPSSTKDERYKYMYSVELVNQLVLEGMPFRDAYKEVGKRIQEGTFVVPEKLHHSHEGSIGNLCNDQIAKRFEAHAAFFIEESRKIQQDESRLLGA
jgi:argininosuccinate lyase